MQVALKDPARLAAVQACGLLDAPPDPALDEIARTAIAVTGVRRAVISLVDARHSFFVADQGRTAGRVREVAVAGSLCRHVIGADDEVVVDDARHDPRRASTALLTGVGAWASFPVRSADRLVVGTLSVLAPEPREWSSHDLQALRTLTRAAGAEMEVRRLDTQLVRTEETARKLSDVQRRTARELLRLSEVMSRSLFPHGRWALGSFDLATAVIAPESPLASANFVDVSALPGPRWVVSTGGVGERGYRAGELADYTRRCLRAYSMTQGTVTGTIRGVDHAIFDRVGHRGPDIAVTTVWMSPAPDGALDVECIAAGHLPPLVRGQDGALRWIGVDRLGGDDAALGNEVAPMRPVATTRLLPGEILVLAGAGVRDALVDTRMIGSAALMPLQRAVERAIGPAAGGGLDLQGIPRRLVEVASRAGGRRQTEFTALAVEPTMPASTAV